jgi:hypothetical protein
MLNTATKTSWIGRLRIGTLCALVSTASALPAHASSTTCPFTNADEGCGPITEAWPADARPTFAMYCFSCALDPPDAAPLPCSEVSVDPSQFWLEIDGVRLQGGTFEATSATCPVFWQGGSNAPGKVFRYTGPLRPGSVHKVHHNRSSYGFNGFVGSFTVAEAKMGSGSPLDSGNPSATTDASTNTPVVSTGDSGCRVGGNRSSSGSPTTLLWFGALIYLWRRQRQRAYARSGSGNNFDGKPEYVTHN